MDGRPKVIFEANWHESVIELDEAQCYEENHPRKPRTIEGSTIGTDNPFIRASL